jgi:hypothetical protein
MSFFLLQDTFSRPPLLLHRLNNTLSCNEVAFGMASVLPNFASRAESGWQSCQTLDVDQLEESPTQVSI